MKTKVLFIFTQFSKRAPYTNIFLITIIVIKLIGCWDFTLIEFLYRHDNNEAEPAARCILNPSDLDNNISNNREIGIYSIKCTLITWLYTAKLCFIVVKGFIWGGDYLEKVFIYHGFTDTDSSYIVREKMYAGSHTHAAELRLKSHWWYPALVQWHLLILSGWSIWGCGSYEHTGALSWLMFVAVL